MQLLVPYPDLQPLKGWTFAHWLADPVGLRSDQPLSLRQIDRQLHDAFLIEPGVDWRSAIELCIAALIERGLRPMLPNADTGAWEWTERFHGFEVHDSSPLGIAEGVIGSWVAFGGSGGAEALRFGTVLPAYIDDRA